MLYMVPIEQLLGSDFTYEALNVYEALDVTTKSVYVNKLHDIFHCHPRRLEALVKSDVVNWPFYQKKVKPVSFDKFLNPCDDCGIAKTTRVMFKGKIITYMTVGSLWQTNISGKWATPSMQGNTYTIGFIKRKSK